MSPVGGLQYLHADPTDPPANGEVPVFSAAANVYVPTILSVGNVTAGGTLTANELVIGAGTTAVAALGALGTTTTVLHGNAAGAPTFGAASLTADVTGTLAAGNGGTGITSLGANVATWLGTPSSANLAAALTDETGTGLAVFATAPTLTGPVTITEAVGSSGLTITGATQTASFPALSITQTWNNAGVTFKGILANITNTASASGSRPLDLQVSTVSTLISEADGTWGFQFPAGGTGYRAFKFVPIGNGWRFQRWTNGFGGASTAILELNNAVTTDTLVVQAGTFVAGGTLMFTTNYDVALVRDAANTLALRNGTAAQEFRPYGYFASATSRAYGVVKCALGAVTLTGATSATGNIIPVGCFVIGVATTTTTTITGASGYQIGDGADADRWGDITGTAVGTDSDNTDSTANPTGYNAAAAAVTLTAKTSNFTGGVVQVVVYYLTTGAD